MYGGDCNVAIAKAAAAVTHVQSQSQEVSSEGEGLDLFGFDLSSAETEFWWLEDDSSRDYASHFRVSYDIFMFIVEAVKPMFSACTHDDGCP